MDGVPFGSLPNNRLHQLSGENYSFIVTLQYVAKSPGGTKRGFGLDCAILACQMYIGNIVSASISSPIIGLFNTVRAMLLTTGFCHLIAFLFAYFFVFYPDENGAWCTQRSVQVWSRLSILLCNGFALCREAESHGCCERKCAELLDPWR